MDLKEVLSNIAMLCHGTKLTMEEHSYLQSGLKEISDKLKELEDLKAKLPAEKKEAE